MTERAQGSLDLAQIRRGAGSRASLAFSRGAGMVRRQLRFSETA